MDGYGNYCSSHYNERGPPSKQFMKSSANVRFFNSDQKGGHCGWSSLKIWIFQIGYSSTGKELWHPPPLYPFCTPFTQALKRRPTLKTWDSVKSSDDENSQLMPKAQPKLENLILHLILPALVGIKLICTFKVENILKGSLDSIPLPSP